MDFKNKNIINFLKPANINHDSMMMLVLTLLPAVFVTKTLESTLVYLLLTFIFVVMVVMIGKLIDKIVLKEIRFIIVIITLGGLAGLLSTFAKAIFINYSNEFNLYTYLLTISALPYMLLADNEEKNFGYSMLNGLQSFLGLAIVMIMVGLLREVLSTGALTFGNYTNINFKLNMFPKYAMGVLGEPLGAILIVGLLLTVVNRRGEEA